MSGHTSPRKKLGQHFLVDNNIVDQIVEVSGVSPGMKTLEIGPGKGILTKALLAAGADLVSVEIDAELYYNLRKELESNENFRIINANALKFDMDQLTGKYQVVSNLPYSVSVPLIQRFIAQGQKIESMTLMTQEEVGRRLVAEPDDSHHGSLSLYTEFHCERKYLFSVGPEVFRPRPKVNSAVIRLTPRKAPLLKVSDEDDFFSFIKTAFVHRRKTLRNNLKGLIEEEGKLLAAMESASLSPEARPQTVSLEQYAALFGLLTREPR